MVPPSSTPVPNVQSLNAVSNASTNPGNMQNSGTPHTSIASTGLPFPPFAVPPGTTPQQAALMMDPMLFHQLASMYSSKMEQEDREKREREFKEREMEFRKIAALTAGQLQPNPNSIPNLYEQQLLELQKSGLQNAQLLELQKRYALGFPAPSPLGQPQSNAQNVGQGNASQNPMHPNFGLHPGLNHLSSHNNNSTANQQQSQLNSSHPNSSSANANASAEALQHSLSNERLQNERLHAAAVQHNNSAALANAAHLANLPGLHHDSALVSSLLAAGQLPPNLQPQSNQSQQHPSSLLGQQQGGNQSENNQLHHPMLPPGFPNPSQLARGPTPNSLFPRPEHLNHPNAGLLRPPHGYEEQLTQQVR